MRLQNTLGILVITVLSCFSALAEHTPSQFTSLLTSDISASVGSLSISNAQPSRNPAGFGHCQAAGANLGCTIYLDVSEATLTAQVQYTEASTGLSLPVGNLLYTINNSAVSVAFDQTADPSKINCELSSTSSAAAVSLSCTGSLVTPPAPTPTPTILEFVSQITGGIFSGTPVWTTGFTGCEVNYLANAINCPKVDLSMVGSSFTVQVSSGSTVLGVLTYTVLSNGTVGVALTPASGTPSGCHATQTQIAPTSTSIETDADVSSCVSPRSQSNNSKNWIKMAEVALKAAVQKIVAL